MVTHSCLGNPMDRGAWWATVRGVARKYDWAQVHNVLYLRPYQSSVLHTAVCMCQSQEKYVWCILTWFLFPSHCWEHEGAFLWFLLWEPGWDPGDKSCKAVGACYDGVPLEILALRLVYMEHLGDSNITAEVFPSTGSHWVCSGWLPLPVLAWLGLRPCEQRLPRGPPPSLIAS